MYTFMQESSRKKELLNRFGFISPPILNGYDYLWILNTSCNYCSIKISCINLSLYYYHSVIFSSSNYPISQDATFKNYSLCPDVFCSRTDNNGFYFVHYYYYYYPNIQDKFNFSYDVSKEMKYPISEKDTNIYDVSLNQNENFIFNSNNCSTSCSHWIFDCIFCSRFMHASSVVNSSIYVHGGKSSKNIDNRIFIRYRNNKWERVPVKTKKEPPCLFAHSMDYNTLKNELILYGGIECDSSHKKSISDIVWVFDLTVYIWTQFNESNSKPAFGHSIHVYKDVMYSFFGLSNFSSEENSILSIIQKFNLSTRKWMKSISKSSLNNFNGLLYHSTSHNASTVVIYGGLTMNNSKSIVVNNALYVFNLDTDEWKVIDISGPQLYLHSTAIINDKLFIVGGKIDTENSNNKTHTEISRFIYQFDALKRTWSQYTNIYKEFMSFGGQLVVKDNYTILIVGGKLSAYKQSLIAINFEGSFNKYKPQSLVSNENAVQFGYCNHSQCESCVENECVWIALSQSCISRFQLTILYIVGEFDGHILYRNQCPVKCEDLTNSGCRNCTNLKYCGWCEFENGFSGVGRCIEGTVYGPNKDNCPKNNNVVKSFKNYTFQNNWSFLPSHCSTCNCNGHASCLKNQSIEEGNSQLPFKCFPCLHNTTGDQCQTCEQGFQGSPINGKNCSPCKCLLDKSARYCNLDGDCSEYCMEKGRIGKYCNECDIHNNFTKFHDMCVIKSKINFKYVLNETDNINIHITCVRFLLTDRIPNVDLGFKIRCVKSYGTKVRVELFNAFGNREILISDTNCTFLENIFPKSLFEGKSSYQLLFTISGFNVTLSKFHIEIIFTQKIYTNLPYIFISLFACLFTALLLFYTIYKMHQHMRLRNQNYRPFMIMERPFVKISLKTFSDSDISDNAMELNNLIDRSEGTNQSKYSHQFPLVCIEPYLLKDAKVSNPANESKINSTAAVVTFLFQSPKCAFSPVSSNSQDSPFKHSSRILIGSTLIKLNEKDRKLLLDLPTKSYLGNNLMVERDFDTSISPSAADELMITEV